MRQNLFQSIAVVLVAVAMLAGNKSAKADIVGIGLGYDLDRDLIAIDFLIPLGHHGEKRPQGGVLNLGLHIRGANNERGGLYTSSWVSLALPVAYEHVFDSGISIIAGAEFVYSDYQETIITPDDITNADDNVVSEKRLGGGIVLGTHYFFKAGVFLGLQIAAGAVSYEEIYQEGDYVRRSGIYGYASPTFSVGYMF